MAAREPRKRRLTVSTFRGVMLSQEFDPIPDDELLAAAEALNGPVPDGAERGSPQLTPREAGQAKPVIVVEYRRRGLWAKLTPPALILMAALLIHTTQRSTPVRPLAPRADLAALARVKSLNSNPSLPAPKVVFRSKEGEAETTEPAEETSKAGVAENVKVTDPEPLPALAPGVKTTKASGTPDQSVPGGQTGQVAGNPPPPAVEAVAAATPAPTTPSPVPASPVAVLGPEAAVNWGALPPLPRSLNPSESRGMSAALALRGPVPASPAVPERAPVPAPQPEMHSEPQPAVAAVSNMAPGAPGVPVPSQDDVLRDIRREADEAQAHMAELERFKGNDVNGGNGSAAAGNVEADRKAFREELKDLLNQFGNNAGPEIERLCARFGRDISGAAKSAYAQALRSTSMRLSRDDRVQLMRSTGLPETVILDHIAHGVHKTVRTRGGPKNVNEVWVFAARILLAIPERQAAVPAVARPGAGAGGGAVSIRGPAVGR